LLSWTEIAGLFVSTQIIALKSKASFHIELVDAMKIFCRIRFAFVRRRLVSAPEAVLPFLGRTGQEACAPSLVNETFRCRW
jgi:hypothetical protein